MGSSRGGLIFAFILSLQVADEVDWLCILALLLFAVAGVLSSFPRQALDATLGSPDLRGRSVRRPRSALIDNRNRDVFARVLRSSLAGRHFGDRRQLVRNCDQVVVPDWTDPRAHHWASSFPRESGGTGDDAALLVAMLLSELVAGTSAPIARRWAAAALGLVVDIDHSPRRVSDAVACARNGQRRVAGPTVAPPLAATRTHKLADHLAVD